MNKSCDSHGSNQTEHSFGRFFAFNFSFSSVGFLGHFLDFLFSFFLAVGGTQRAAMMKLFSPENALIFSLRNGVWGRSVCVGGGWGARHDT